MFHTFQLYQITSAKIQQSMVKFVVWHFAVEMFAPGYCTMNWSSCGTDKYSAN